jgi:hypothetical protein
VRFTAVGVIEADLIRSPQCLLCAKSGHSAKAERVALIKHHKTKLVHKVRMERHPKAKTVTMKF